MRKCGAEARKLVGLALLALVPGLLGVRCDSLLKGSVVGPGDVDPAAFHARQLAFLRYATQDPNPGGITNVINHLERRVVDPPYIPSFVLPANHYDGVFKNTDTSDFDVLYLMNLYLGYRNDPALDPGLVAKLESEFLKFKYWYTEPTPATWVRDNAYYWSENHQIIFHTLEYMAGQSFPDQVFLNDGKTGREHQAHAKALLLEWIDYKVRFGFNEWHSDVYYQKDATPLLTLVEYAEDEEVRTRAAMALDLLLFDIASHQFRGYFGVTHGRSYKNDKMEAEEEDSYGLTKLLFDESPTPWNTSTGEPGATMFARAKRYHLPEAIWRIAKSRAASVDEQRLNLFIDETGPITPDPVAPGGFSYTDPATLPLWWGMGALTVWQLIPLTLDSLDRYNLWDIPNFEPFKPFQSIIAGNVEFGQATAKGLARTAALGILNEVHTYTYRTSDYMLSTAQDYRAGSRGAQYHAWQATLGPKAIVFTTHPGLQPPKTTSWSDDSGPPPGYWTGSASMPRSAQHENVAIHLYAPQYLEIAGPARPLTRYEKMTHAFFPQDRFDEVVQEGPWTFGREDDGYVALYSWRPAAFLDYTGTGFATDGMTKPFDLVAGGGADNVWIVECARAADWPSFAAFRSAVAASRVDVTPLGDHGARAISDGFSVRYESPSQGVMTFGWSEPLTVAGKETVLANPLRFDSPWARQAFDTRRVVVQDDPSLATGYGVWLDFENGVRRTFGPAPPTP